MFSVALLIFVDDERIAEIHNVLVCIVSQSMPSWGSELHF
jgi:hypothetical protein